MKTQETVSSRSAERRRQRGQRQMTLGALITRLSEFPIGAKVERVSNFDCYRGIFEDLALTRDEGTMLASELAQQCKYMVGQVFEGYKGGEFEMDEETPIWIAKSGELGPMLVAVGDDGQMVMATAPE